MTSNGASNFCKNFAGTTLNTADLNKIALIEQSDLCILSLFWQFCPKVHSGYYMDLQNSVPDLHK